MRKIEITEDMKQQYIKLYKETYSVTQVMNIVNDGVGRRKINKILKDAGIYEGLNGPNYLKKKQEVIQNIMVDRYGVRNISQLKKTGYTTLNKIEYQKIGKINEELHVYKSAVRKLTEKNIKEHYNKNLPEYCYYTGIRFADAIQDKVNPNDPRKRSIDHKLPIIMGYYGGHSVEEVADINNITFVLKYVNTVKCNMPEDAFIPLAKKIREVFIHEGFESK